MKDTLPKFKAEPAPEDMPQPISLPQLSVCTAADNRLTIPREIRTSFLTCPIFGPEWRELLASFDREWAADAVVADEAG